MTDIFQRADDPSIAPRGILLRHSHNQSLDLGENARTTTALLRIRPLAGDEPPMPAQNRVGCDDRRDLTEARRPSRCPYTASRRRSSSARRIRPRTCPRRMWFSSIRYATASCCRWSSKPTSAVRSMLKGNASSTARESIQPTRSQDLEAPRSSNKTLRASPTRSQWLVMSCGRGRHRRVARVVSSYRSAVGPSDTAARNGT
jgi:hypothetical protein